MMGKSLDELEVGKKAVVKMIRGEKDIKRRLLDMGLVPGTELRVEKVAPLGDPIDISLKGYYLSLRKHEARAVKVEIR
ncbi:MAG TPA: ferrous iron transport protein A [Deltaproteobacteria bacterium]|nr:ferrous iron transport protein A [Deltaproteobacteria bacterium]